MPLNTRQQDILETLGLAGHVEVENLAHTMGVTTQTVRRDLNDLVMRGLVARTHGGARKLLSTATMGYEGRRQINIAAKQSIAQATANLIPNGASVALNIGTTTEQVAQALRLHTDLTVLTNNINILHILRDARLRSMIVVGGEVRPSDGAIIGDDAVAAIGRYKVDIAVIGTSSLDPDGSVLDFDPREVAVARALLANARQTVLVADTTKFDISATHRICHLSDLDHVVLNAAPPAEFVAAAKRAETNIIIAEGSP
jgi:DeoR family glycerol-3-phosphate regulon repressor